MNLDYQILVPKYKPTNREQKRTLLNEYARIMPNLHKVDSDFLLDIITLPLPYKVIYAKHLELFVKHLDWITEVQKPRHFKLNYNYFEQMYKPLEEETEDVEPYNEDEPC